DAVGHDASVVVGDAEQLCAASGAGEHEGRVAVDAAEATVQVFARRRRVAGVELHGRADLHGAGHRQNAAVAVSAENGPHQEVAGARRVAAFVDGDPQLDTATQQDTGLVIGGGDEGFEPFQGGPTGQFDHVVPTSGGDDHRLAHRAA